MRADLSHRYLVLAALAGGLGWAPVAAEDQLSAVTGQNNQAIQLAAEGRNEEAESLYLAALDAHREDDLMRSEIANNLAVLYRREDRYMDAERRFGDVLRWRQRNLLSGSPELAYAFNNLAEIYRLEGRDWEARNLMETAVRSVEQFHPQDPGLPPLLSNLAIVLCRFGEFGKSEELLRKALLHYEITGTGSRDHGVTLSNLGQVLELKNEREAAAPLYERAIGIFERLGDPAKPDLAAALAKVGTLYQRLNRLTESLQAEQRALNLLPPAGHAGLRAQILRNIASIMDSMGHPAESLPFFEQSLGIQEKTLGADRPDTVALLLDFSAATLHAGNMSLSRKLRKRALDLLARLNARLTERDSLERMTVSLGELRAAK